MFFGCLELIPPSQGDEIKITETPLIRDCQSTAESQPKEGRGSGEARRAAGAYTLRSSRARIDACGALGKAVRIEARVRVGLVVEAAQPPRQRRVELVVVVRVARNSLLSSLLLPDQAEGEVFSPGEPLRGGPLARV